MGVSGISEPQNAGNATLRYALGWPYSGLLRDVYKDESRAGGLIISVHQIHLRSIVFITLNVTAIHLNVEGLGMKLLLISLQAQQSD